jgi:hypothetical protein
MILTLKTAFNIAKLSQGPALLAEYCFIITLEQSIHPPTHTPTRPPVESIKTAFYSSR